MSWRDWFRAAPPPPPEHDPRLGTLTWVAENDGWCGTFNGYRFVLSHEGQSSPPEALKSYALELLGDREELERALALAIAEAPSDLRRFEDEMRELTYDQLYLHAGPKGRSVFASLRPGRDYRNWRLEFVERRCLGIGFDT